MSKNNCDFDYLTAFSRNIGWLTKEEQLLLRQKRVAIAGLGGVGGSHLLTLTRLGVGKFNIADLDSFELANFNRQAGASCTSLKEEKIATLTKMATDINPELNIQQYPTGIDKGNVELFLDNVDLYIDGLDFFALDARRTVFDACTKKRIPIVTAAPLGMGVALICYTPGGMPLNRYFGLENGSDEEQILRFLLGLSPTMMQRHYLVDPNVVDLINHRGPSTSMACDLCAGVAGTTAVKILLNRGKVISAPYGLHYDPYLNRYKKTWRPWGYKNPVQKIIATIARKQLAHSPKTA